LFLRPWRTIANVYISQDAEKLSAPGMHSIVVDHNRNAIVSMLARRKKIKNGKAHNTCNLQKDQGHYEVASFMSTFVLNKMCSNVIKSGMGTKKGFKDVHLNNVSNKMFAFCSMEVSLQQVFNHL
jgi:hypothetical protein